eukprot:2751879-Amphidinium_carterae.1
MAAARGHSINCFGKKHGRDNTPTSGRSELDQICGLSQSELDQICISESESSDFCEDEQDEPSQPRESGPIALLFAEERIHVCSTYYPA